MTVYDLYQTTEGYLAIDRDPETVPLGRIVTDSREVVEGDLFWALRGMKHNGSRFAQHAFDQGACGVVVDEPIDPPPGRWSLIVNHTLKALWQWAAWKRRRFTGTMIAVTGSVGKTTTRQMIHTVLSSRFKGVVSPRNYNNQFGVPLSMMALEPDHNYAVMELGASGPGEIGLLAGLCRPKIGVVTQVADAHLGGFGSRRGVAEAKAELLAALPPDGNAVVVDTPWAHKVTERCIAPITWVGTNPQNKVTARDVSSQNGKLSFSVDEQTFEVPVWGEHHIGSALAAIATGRLFGLGYQEIAEAMKLFEPVPMRCEVVELRSATIINDTYNASPTAMRAALELLRDFDTEGHRIVVCGDMAELGDEAAELHYKFGNETVSLCGADMVIACGEYARAVVDGAHAAGMPGPRAIPCRTVDDAMPFLGQAIMPGDVVLVKGSRVMCMERVVNALRSYPLRKSA
jgi:UDP-N-acetylmuramoyl-tripeptide--D-alanyl-D-alanine ligase